MLLVVDAAWESPESTIAMSLDGNFATVLGHLGRESPHPSCGYEQHSSPTPSEGLVHHWVPLKSPSLDGFLSQGRGSSHQTRGCASRQLSLLKLKHARYCFSRCGSESFFEFRAGKRLDKPASSLSEESGYPMTPRSLLDDYFGIPSEAWNSARLLVAQGSWMRAASAILNGRQRFRWKV